MKSKWHQLQPKLQILHQHQLLQLQLNLQQRNKNALELGEFQISQKILECPVCFNTPENPDQVNFCSNGHMLCNDCHKKILEKKCPTCRSEDWNGHHTLLPLMKQILSALPKVCPFPECETQLEDKDREDYVKSCKYRLFECVETNGTKCCNIKLTVKDGVSKHFEESHKIKKRPNTQGQFEYRMTVNSTHLDVGAWNEYITDFDKQSFILTCYRKKNIFNIQLFIVGSVTEAEKYLFEIKCNTLGITKQSISFIGDVISVDVPIANNARENHCGTFSFTTAMAKKWMCEENRLIFKVTIRKNKE